MAGAAATRNPFLHHFWTLADVREEERVAASAALVLAVLQEQAESDAAASDDAAGAAAPCKALTYTLKRLVRGLSSGRKAARQGFATALTQLLSCIPMVSAAEVCDLIDGCIETGGNLKQRELRDAYFGRVFGLMALARSGRLFAADTEASVVQRVFKDLLGYAAEKVYLQEVALRVAVLCIEGLERARFPEVWDALAPAVHVETPTAASVALTFACRRHAKVLKKQSGVVLEQQWAHGDLLHADCLKPLARALRDCALGLPSIHPAWELLLAELVRPQREQAFRKFWHACVDQAMFGEKRATHDRKAFGFALACRVLPLVSARQLPDVLTPNIMRSFIANLGSGQNLLRPAAAQVAETIAAVAARDAEDDAMRFALLGLLLGEHGSTRFDAMSRTKTVSTILSNLTLEGVHRYVTQLKERFMQAEDATAEAERIWVADQLQVLVRNSHVPHDEDWTMAVAKFFFVYGFYNVEAGADDAFPAPGAELNMSTQLYFQKRFFSVLSDLCTDTAYGPKAEASGSLKPRPMPGAAADGELRAHTLLEFILAVRANDKLDAIDPFDDSIEDVFKRVVKCIKKARKVCRPSKKRTPSRAILEQARAFEVLLLQVVIQLFNGPRDIVSVVDDLEKSFDEVLRAAKAQSKSAAAGAPPAAEDGDAAEDASAVLVDILLSFLATPSALLRSIVKSVFRAFCSTLTLQSLQLILAAIQEDDVIGMVDDEHEHEHMDHDHSDAEEANGEDEGEEDGEEEEEEEESDSSSDDDEDEEEDEEEAVDQELKRKLAEELGVPETGDPDDSGDDSDWDDARMMKIDSALSAHFRAHKFAQKKQVRQEKLERMHFQLRVSDLVEIFVRDQPSNGLVLELVLPLVSSIVRVAGDSKAKPLFDRLRGLLRNRLCAIKTYPKPPSLDENGAHEILAELFSLVSAKPLMAEMVSHALVFVFKVLIGGAIDQTETDGQPTLGHLRLNEALPPVEELISKFAAKSGKIPLSLLTDLAKRFPAFMWRAMPTLAKSVVGCQNSFRLSSLLEIMGVLLSPGKAKGHEALYIAYSEEILQCFTDLLRRAPELKIKPVRAVVKLCQQYFKQSTAAESLVELDTAGLEAALTALVASDMAKSSAPLKRNCEQLVRGLSSKAASEADTAQPQMNGKRAKGKKGSEAAADAAQTEAGEREAAGATAGEEDPDSRGKKKKKAKKPKKRKAQD